MHHHRNYHALLRILLALYVVALAVTIALFVLDKAQVHVWDSLVATQLFDDRTGVLVTIFTYITGLGKWYIVSAVAVLMGIAMYKKRHLRKFLVPLVITLVGTVATVGALKEFFHRARPGGLLPTYTENTFSFPSGHAAIAISFYGFLLFLLLRRTTKKEHWLLLFLLGIILIIAIGFSRLYLGVHFLSDVWGGYIVGGGWLLIGMVVYETRRHLTRRHESVNL